MKLINYTQLGEEAGVEIKGILIKGETITFLDLSEEDETKEREALKTHIAIFPKRVTNQDIMNKLNAMDIK